MKFRAARKIAAIASMLFVLAGLSLVVASPASASGCTLPPCGKVVNQTSGTYILVRWKNNDSDPWSTASVAPGSSMGGYGGSPRRDIDNFWAPSRCTTKYTLGGNKTSSGGSWIKISSTQTATIKSVTCVDD